jgi:hypothetical protein
LRIEFLKIDYISYLNEVYRFDASSIFWRRVTYIELQLSISLKRLLLCLSFFIKA